MRPVVDSIAEKIEIEIDTDGYVPVMIESRFDSHENYVWRAFDGKSVCEFEFSLKDPRFCRLTVMATGCKLHECALEHLRSRKSETGVPIFRPLDGAKSVGSAHLYDSDEMLWIGFSEDRGEIAVRFSEESASREIDSELGVAWGFGQGDALVYVRVYECPPGMVANLIEDASFSR